MTASKGKFVSGRPNTPLRPCLNPISPRSPVTRHKDFHNRMKTLLRISKVLEILLPPYKTPIKPTSSRKGMMQELSQDPEAQCAPMKLQAHPINRAGFGMNIRFLACLTYIRSRDLYKARTRFDNQCLDWYLHAGALHLQYLHSWACLQMERAVRGKPLSTSAPNYGAACVFRGGDRSTWPDYMDNAAINVVRHIVRQGKSE